MGLSQSVLISPERLVSNYMKGKIKRPNYHRYNYESAPHSTEKAEDDLTELKGIATDIVTNVFLADSECMYNFLGLIVNRFERAIRTYIRMNRLKDGDIFFLYKGGNILRIISSDFLRELPRSANLIIQNYYEQFFKKSDADFSIIINPDLPNFDRIQEDMTLISFFLQGEIRNVIEHSKTDYLAIYKYKPEYREVLLSPYYEKAMNAECFRDDRNSLYGGRMRGIVLKNTIIGDTSRLYKKRNDFIIQFMDDKDVEKMERSRSRSRSKNRKHSKSRSRSRSKNRTKSRSRSRSKNRKQSKSRSRSRSKNRTRPQERPTDPNQRYTVQYEVGSNDSIMTVQSNTTIEKQVSTKKGDRYLIKFNLIRTKINFNFVIETKRGGVRGFNIGGELIDISIPHRDDNKSTHFYHEYKKHVQMYKLSYPQKPDFLFRSYKYTYLISDLEYILFIYVDLPWEDNKYLKRINRLFYLYVIDMFIKLPDVGKLKKFLISLMDNVFTHNVPSDIQIIQKNIRTLCAKKEYRNLAVNFILNQISDMTTRIHTKTDIRRMNELLNNLLQNCSTMNNAFKTVRNYCSVEGKIHIQDILYDNEFRAAF